MTHEGKTQNNTRNHEPKPESWQTETQLGLDNTVTKVS